MEGIDFNAIIKGGIIVALIAQISLILKSTTAVLGFLKEHFVSKSQYAEDLLEAERQDAAREARYAQDKLQAEKDEAARKEWIVRHVEERAEHKATQAATAMLSKFQTLETKIDGWMEARKERETESHQILKDVLERLRSIELSCAGHSPNQVVKP